VSTTAVSRRNNLMRRPLQARAATKR
jgi:hypothetical protein